MKLSYGCRCKLRKQIEEILKNVPDGQKIHLDKDLLEELLFEKEILCGTGNENKKAVAKLPVWSGTFLRKIDLSEVSFKNVCWAAEFYLLSSLWDKKYSKFLSNVNYSYTNAKINFADAFYVTYHGLRSIYIQHCNFEGVDLSNTKFDNELFELYLSNISNTNICLKNTKKIVFTDSNVSNIDLSFIKVNLDDMFDEDKCFKLDSTNFYNTGLQITCNEDSLEKYQKSKFIKCVNSGKLQGCYLNGQLINSAMEEQISKLVRKNICGSKAR